MRRNMVAEVMGEPCIYGGLLATRGEVAADLTAQGVKWPLSDRLTWMCKPASAEDVAFLRSVGMTLAAVREKESVA